MSFLIETYVPKPDKNIDIISNFGSDTLIFTITQIVYTRDKFTLSLEAINKDDAEGDDAKIEVDLFHGKEPDTRNLVSGSTELFNWGVARFVDNYISELAPLPHWAPPPNFFKLSYQEMYTFLKIGTITTEDRKTFNRDDYFELSQGGNGRKLRKRRQSRKKNRKLRSKNMRKKSKRKKNSKKRRQ